MLFRLAFAVLLVLISGAANGLHEVLMHHYSYFERRFPFAPRAYWNPRESWRNKYRDGVEEHGPRFFGATTFFAWLTDAKHLLGTIEHFSLVSGVGLLATSLQIFFPSMVAGSVLTYTLGFHAVYTLWFRPR